MPEFEPRRIFISGGAGFVGSRLALRLQEEFPQAAIVVIDDFSSGKFENLDGFRGDVVAAKMGDPCFNEEIGPFRSHRSVRDAAFFHQAAITDTTVHDPIKVMRANVESFRQAVLFCRSINAKLVYASSSAVYGKHPKKPMVVGRGEHPLNVYAFSKLTMDNIARREMEEGALDLVGLRYFNVYGPGESHKGKAASMIYRMHRQMLVKDYFAMEDGSTDERWGTLGESVRRVGLFEGSVGNSRDWIHVDDVVRANLLALNAGTGIYNVGTGRSTSFLDLVHLLRSAMGLKSVEVLIDEIPNPAPQFYQEFTQADMSDTVKALGQFDPAPIERGIASYVSELSRDGEGKAAKA